jgi:3-deoxy-D-manno-octulosonic-acid transferase
MTTATPTGAQRVRELFKTDVSHAFLPYDTPDAVGRFLDRVRPSIAIVLETEVWPHLYRGCARRGIRIVLASARLSTRSAKRLRWAAPLFRSLLSADIAIAAQTQDDAARFMELGAVPERVLVSGNIKFDLQIGAEVAAHGQQLRQAQFASRFVWTAGSTHPVEEQMVLDAHLQLCQRDPSALLIVAPRHPQRFAAVRDWLAAQQVKFATRSAGDAVSDAHRVLLVDTMGELQLFYAAADVAFVGGTLVPIGGHNLLEPAALALPVLMGPHNFNAPDIARLLVDAGAARLVESAPQLAAAIRALADDGAQRKEMGMRGQHVVAANRGALAKVLALIESRHAR